MTLCACGSEHTPLPDIVAEIQRCDDVATLKRHVELVGTAKVRSLDEIDRLTIRVRESDEILDALMVRLEALGVHVTMSIVDIRKKP